MAISYIMTNLPTIGGIQVDSNLSENITFSNQIPSHPIESGYSVSDAIIREPVEVSLDCIVAKDSLAEQSLVQDSSAFRPDNTYAKLEKLVRSATLVTAVTSVRIFRNMGIVSLSIPRTSQDGLNLKFTINLREVIVVKSKMIIDEFSSDASTLGNTDVNKGFQDFTKSEFLSNYLPPLDELRVEQQIRVP
jgi:hypothetical protein